MDEVKAPLPFEWRGVTYDFAKYDEVRYWQENGRQHCWLSNRGRTEQEVPVTDLSEALLIERAFLAVRPRLHVGNADVLVGVPIPIDRQLQGR